MGQGKCVEGSGPHNSHPAAKGRSTWEGWWTPSEGAHGDNTRQRSERKVKSDQCKGFEVLWTSHGGDGNLSLFRPLLKAEPPFSGGQTDKQRAPPEPSRWGLSTWPELDKEQCKQHMAQIQISTHSTSVSPGPPGSPAWSWCKGWQWRTALAFTKGPRKVREKQHWTRRNSWVTPQQLMPLTCILKATGWSGEPFVLQIDSLNAYLL